MGVGTEEGLDQGKRSGLVIVDCGIIEEMDVE